MIFTIIIWFLLTTTRWMKFSPVGYDFDYSFEIFAPEPLEAFWHFSRFWVRFGESIFRSLKKRKVRELEKTVSESEPR